MALFLQLSLRGSMQMLPPLLSSQQLFVRCISASVVGSMKRPVFDGPRYPKKPLVPSILFIMDRKNTIPSESNNALDLKTFSKMWRDLPSPDKMVYQDRYVQLKERYKVEVTDFLDSLGGKEDQQRYLDDLKEYRKKRREYIKYLRLKRLGIVKPGRLTAYNVFVSDHRNEFMHGNDPQSLKDGMLAIHAKWKELNDSEKASFAKRAESILTERETEYEQKYNEAVKKGLVKPPVEKKAPAKKPKKKVTKKVAAKKSTIKKVSTRKKPEPVKATRKTKTATADVNLD